MYAGRPEDAQRTPDTSDPSCRSTLSRAEPGRSGQSRAGPGVALDRVFFNRIWCPEMELFSYFFETFFKTCIKGVRQWVVKSEAVFETCIKGVRQWEGKSDDFPCFPGRGKPAASQSRSLDTSTVPSTLMLREGVRLGCNLY